MFGRLCHLRLSRTLHYNSSLLAHRALDTAHFVLKIAYALLQHRDLVIRIFLG
jgi:hypothetical protein